MNVSATIILGAVAILIAVVLVGPVSASVVDTTEDQDCSYTAAAESLNTAGGDTAAAPAKKVTKDITINVSGNGNNGFYRAGTLCSDSSAQPTSPVTADTNAGKLAVAKTPSGPLAYLSATKSLIQLVPLVFVAVILGLPIMLIYQKVRA